MDKLKNFLDNQLAYWEMARNNYQRLDQIMVKSVDFGSFRINVQYNPTRLHSAVAKIDPEFLRQRPCALCMDNIPAEQDNLDYNAKLDIRINPYPIFSAHFTVPAKTHTDQRIQNNFGDMLSLTADFPGYFAFYNGPRSGASIPDHMHFQLAPRHTLPIEEEMLQGPRQMITTRGRLTIETLHPYLRKNLILRGDNRQEVEEGFFALLKKIGEVTFNDPEPMINLFCWHIDGSWWVVIFPRRQHRPWQFFAEGEEQILFSPGCVDFAGMVIAPRKVDFDRYNPELFTDLFAQLTLDDNQWDKLQKSIREE